MNTPPTNPRDLDSFETALLTELREHVAARPATESVTTPVTHRRHYGRWAVGFAVAAATATAVVIASPGGPGASPAYAVSQESDGDVVVTIHRLEDSAGLEAALRDKGIDAEVSFDPMTDDGNTTFQVPGGVADDPPEGGQLDSVEEPGEGEFQEPRPAKPGEELDVPDCGGIDDTQPATLSHEGDDWVLRIPADSILQDRPIQITTGAGGTLGVFYAGNDPGSYCGVMSVGNN